MRDVTYDAAVVSAAGDQLAVTAGHETADKAAQAAVKLAKSHAEARQVWVSRVTQGAKGTEMKRVATVRLW